MPYSYKYADLADVLDAVTAALNAQDLTLTQRCETNEDQKLFRLVTELVHGLSGEKLVSTFPLRTHLSPQELGSELTYYRRYAVCGLLGVAAEEDDDAQQADAAPRHMGNTENSPVKPRQEAAQANRNGPPARSLGQPSGMPADRGGDARSADLNAPRKCDENDINALRRHYQLCGWTPDMVGTQMRKMFKTDKLGNITKGQLAALMAYIQDNRITPPPSTEAGGSSLTEQGQSGEGESQDSFAGFSDGGPPR